MKTWSPNSEAKRRNPGHFLRLAVTALLLPWLAVARADDFAAQCADRTAIERIYYEHRTGTKPPFEQTMPRELVEQLTRMDQHKEAVIRRAYGVELTHAMVEAEVRRIDSTTRAPEILAEIKQALGDDPGRFARAMARPIVVERELRRRFDNDDAQHAAQRREAEQARDKLLAQQPVEGMQEVTWQLTPRPEGNESASAPHPPPPQTKGAAKSGASSVEATAQLAQALTAASLSIPKRSYEEWLALQPAEKP